MNELFIDLLEALIFKLLEIKMVVLFRSHMRCATKIKVPIYVKVKGIMEILSGSMFQHKIVVDTNIVYTFLVVKNLLS